MTRRNISGLLAVAIGAAAACVALGALVGGDPMLGVELAGAALGGLWVGFVVRDLVGMRRVAEVLAADAREACLFGVPCRVTPALGADAVVIGLFRPRIYVGAGSLATLTGDEIRAVVYHEDHHRRTLAPLRAAALLAWLRLLGRSKVAREHIMDRLADLEAFADADAIRRGSDARSLARALLKGEASHQPVSFAYAAERRVEQLLDHAEGLPTRADGRLPYEWLPAMVFSVVLIGCHVGL